ncbi:MAG: ABC transporter substrate-binding protein [Spirochaetia bacterium]|jgi:sulfonate transport system substrate-binding protein|nr:ABC transporter substrate-binding protein [Spirochaetia bacterium]
MKFHGKTFVKKLIVVLAAGSVFAAMALACSQTEKPQAPALNTATKLVVGQNQNYFPIITAHVKGFFKEEFGDRFTVEVPKFANGPAQAEALTSKQIDLGNMGDMPIVQVRANNVDIKVISYLWESPDGYYLLVNKNSGIKSPADLRGKKVGIAIGTNMHKLLFKYLGVEKIKASEVEIVNLDTAGSVSAVTEGLIDATVLAEPMRSRLLATGKVAEAASAQGYDKIVTLLYGRTEYLQQNPDIVARYLKVIDRANRWVAENVDEAVKIVADYMGTTDLEGTRQYYDTHVFKIAAGKDLVDLLKGTIAFCYSQGTITEEFKAEDLVDSSYVKAAGLE